MQICKEIIFRGGQFCYPEVRLTEYDIVFLVVIGSALVAILVGYLKGELK